MSKKQVPGMYIRVCKEVFIDVPKGLSYEDALEYARQAEGDGNLEFDLRIDVLFEDGTVANEAGWE